MDHPDLFKKKKKKHLLEEEPDIDLNSDHPVHESFVDEKGVRQARRERESEEERKEEEE